MEGPDIQTENNAVSGGTKKTKKPKKPKFSGSYYYVGKSAEELAKSSFIRTVLSVVGLLVQAVTLLFIPQGGLEYVTKNIASYAYTYMWLVFVMLAATVYIIIMQFTRYKLDKRIPVERAPKNGFKRRAFLGHEIYMGIYALLLAVEISFVCISYDIYGLIAVFMCAIALAAAVGARQITHLTLKDAELIEAF